MTARHLLGTVGRAVLLVAVMGLAGCATDRTEVPCMSGQGTLTPRVRDVIDPFPYERTPMRVSNHTEGDWKGYVVRRLRFPSVGENGQEGNMVTVRYHESAAPGERPLVVILPIWGGSSYPPAILASDLVSQGWANVMRVLGEDMVIDWGALSTDGKLHGRARGANGHESRYLLTGLAGCGACGGGLTVHSRAWGTGRQHTYVCRHYHRKGTTVCTNRRVLPMVATNAEVL